MPVHHVLGRALLVLFAFSMATSCSRDDASAAGSIEKKLLAERRGGDGPRFRRVPASESGVTFENLLTAANNYTYLTNGAGLAVGDYDGDGLVDVYLVSLDGPNRLYRQVAPFRFEDVTERAGGVGGGEAWGTGACFVDVDGDGDLDLYVCNLEAKNLLYVNQGDGTFREDAARFGLDVVAASTMAAFADFDRDGRLDCYLLTNRALHGGWAATPEVLSAIVPPKDTRRTAAQMVPSLKDLAWIEQQNAARSLQSDEDLPAHLREHFFVWRGRAWPNGQSDRLLRNIGGRFVDVSASAGLLPGGMGLSATWWDFDGDGWPDLYVANDLESPDRLYHNQQNGTFREVAREVLPHTAYYGMGADAGDLDGDGWLDLLVGDMSMTTHKKAKVLMGDMDDEREVLMRAEPPQCMRNALLLNTGRGVFQEAAFLAALASTDWTWSVLYGDLDNDARLDVFVTNGIARFDTDPDLELRVKALWAEQRQQAAIDLIRNVPRVAEKNLALRQAGDLEFVKTGADWGLDLEAVSHGAALVDLDGDGDLDVVVNNLGEPAAIYENLTTDGRAIVVALRGRSSERFGIGARVTATLPDGRRLVREVTPARGYLSGQTTDLHFGLGALDRVVALEVAWPSGRRQRYEDLAADHRYTVTEPTQDQAASNVAVGTPVPIFAAAQAPPHEHRENEFDEYAAQPLLPAEVSRLGPGIAVGDANGDGHDDVFVGGAAGQAGSLHVGTEGGWRHVAGPWQDDAACEDMGIVWIDFDQDGDLDLFVASGGAEVEQGHANLRDRLYRNDGNLRFARVVDALPAHATSSGHVAAGDFDGDGDLDLVVAGRLVPGRYPEAPPTRLYRNDGGRFVDVTADLAPALLTAGMVTSVLFTDVDADGFSDLLLAAHWQPIRLLRNDGGRRFVDDTANAGLAAHVGWWNSLCAWDFDGDGDLDYVAGNQGWNTKYKASAERPARLFWGDFDDDGRRDLVEAKYEGDALYPVRGRSCSSQAMPFLAVKFPTYERFASSLLTDIYGPQALATCGQLEANTLASCVLKNDGRGRFTVEPLPRRAQIAPLFGMVALDDVLVGAQNSFTPEPETGRHDGGTGLVLRAVADQIEVVPAAEHAIAVLGDHKALVLRAGSRPELLQSTNDGPVRAFAATGRTSAAPPAGPPGNPQGVGRRLSIELGDGRRRAIEVHAGSGYLGHGRAFVPATPPRR